MSDPADLLREKPRVFWGRVVAVFIQRGWKPPPLDERMVDDLMAGMELADRIPNDPRMLQSVRADEEKLYGRGLSPQETRILGLIRRGYTNNEIGSELNVKVQTVKFHISNLYRKLGVHNRTQAALWDPDEDSEHNENGRSNGHA